MTTTPPDARNALAEIVALKQERDEALAWIAAATKMITELTGGGSEFFVRKGDVFRADLPFCKERITDRDRRAHERFISENQKRRASDARIAALEAQVEGMRWRSMDDNAPTDGKHCILAIKSGPFVYSIQGAFMNGKWHNAADIEAEPLCWMPNVMLPDEFLPWTRAALQSSETTGEK